MSVPQQPENNAMSLEDTTNKEEHPTQDSCKDVVVNEKVSRVFLPQGAAKIVKQIAAEQIFLEMIDQVVDDTQKPDHTGIFHLLKHFPALVHRRYEIKWENDGTRRLYPLSILSCLQPPLELLQFVYKVNPEALHHKEDVKNTMAFHYLCTFQASLEAVEWMMRLDQSLLNTPRSDEMYPLHLAVFFKAPMQVVDMLIRAWPEGLVRDWTGDWSLLHAAAAAKANLDLVERLYQANPDGILALDERRRTPLHQACWKNGNKDVVLFLLEKAPHALHIEDDGGETPLFRAVRNQTAEVVQLLLPEEPPVDDLGATLLHFAAIDNDADVVSLLLNRHPEMAAAKTRERDQYTPLHSACHFSNNVATLRALVEHSPILLSAVNGHGKTPLQTAQEFNPSKEIVEYMESIEQKKVPTSHEDD